MKPMNTLCGQNKELLKRWYRWSRWYIYLTLCFKVVNHVWVAHRLLSFIIIIVIAVILMFFIPCSLIIY
jgi:hypothetical protein